MNEIKSGDLIWKNLSPKLNIITGSNGSGKSELLLNGSLNSENSLYVSFISVNINNVLDFLITDLENEFKSQKSDINRFELYLLVDKFIYFYNKYMTNIEISFTNNKVKFKRKYNNEVVYFPSLSTGEKHLLYIFLSILSSFSNKNMKTYVFIDNIEIGLSSNIISDVISNIFNLNLNIQLFISINNPLIISDEFRGYIQKIENNQIINYK